MAHESSPLDHQIEVISSLDDPVRRALYRHVAMAARPVGRTEAAEATGISRSLAAFHLDKLVEEGLLEASYERTTGRSGPGAGRPSKFYRRSAQEFVVTLPPRSYELAARLFARALDPGTAAAEPAEEKTSSLGIVARDFGEQLGAEARSVAGPTTDSEPLPEAAEAVLTAYGFEPFQDDDGAIRLGNCPFHVLAEEHRELVCGMNLAIMNGFVEGLGLSEVTASLEPCPGLCCVALRPAQQG